MLGIRVMPESMPESQSHLLVVDDEPANIAVLSDLFLQTCTVAVAKHGEQALARALSRRPDLILLDVMMPGMDGYEVCRRLKADPRTREIPVIFVTALAQESDEEAGLLAGAVDYITKPISPPVVQARVRGVLERGRLERRVAEMQRAYTAMIVHDLRSPLNVISGYAELMLDDRRVERPAGDRMALERIRSNAQRAGALVSEMLDVAQLRAGQVRLKREDLDASALLGQIVDDQALFAKAKSISLTADVAPGLHVDADRQKLTEVVVNLVGNALKFTPASGTIRVEAWDGHAEGLCVRVRDSGPGISARQAESLFAPWQRVDDVTRTAVKGYGLGLAICRMIVEAHGGHIELEPASAPGASFRLNVPNALAA